MEIPSTMKHTLKEHKWEKFPLEYQKYHLIFVYKNDINTFNNKCLFEYLKIIFPSCDGDKYLNGYNPFKKHKLDMSIIHLENVLDWSDTLYLENIRYLLLCGKYSDIPKSLIATSDLIIFEDTDDFNKYFNSYKFRKLENRNEKFFLCVDNNREENYSMKIIDPQSLKKYCR